MILTCTEQQHHGAVVTYDGRLHAHCPLCFNLQANLNLDGIAKKLRDTAQHIDALLAIKPEKPNPNRRKNR